MAPTIDRDGPYRIFFYSNEGHEPTHVHVRRDRSLAKFWLEPVDLAGSSGFPAHELRRIRGIIALNQSSYLEAWHDYFNP